MSQTFFVATDGDDDRGDGSIERPFASIEVAIRKAKANGSDGGDQIFLRAGTYCPVEPLILSEKGGPRRWSRLASWGAERAVIDGRKIPDDPRDGPQSMISVYGHYYEISGLELAHSPKSAISLYGKNVRVTGNVIHDSMGGAVYSDPDKAGSLFFAHNVVYHNCLSNQNRDVPGGWPSAVNLTHHRDIVIGNEIYENYGEGCGAYGSGHHIVGNQLRDNFGAEIYLNNATDTIVEGNLIHSNGIEEFFRDWNLKDVPEAPPPFPFWAPSEGIAMANEEPGDVQFAGNRVINNIITGSHYRAMNWWNGKPGGRGMVESLIAHNTIVSDAEALFHLDDHNHAGTVIRDNIFYQLRRDRPLTDFYGVKGLTFSHNLWFGGNGSTGPAGDGSGPGDVRADPRLGPDLRLQPDSPAINAGIPVGVHLDYFGNQRPYNTRYDIGAHEWNRETDGTVRRSR